MPPIKELHYFDRDRSYPSPSHLASDSILERFTSQERHNRRFRKKFVFEMAKSIVRLSPSEFAWKSRYFLESCSIEWYESLFAAGGSKLKGEITPAYAILSREDVALISEVFSSLKILFLIRNPIHRAWSHVRYDYTNGKISNLRDFQEVKNLIDSPFQERRSDYLRTYDVWTSYFGRENVLVRFYEQIKEEPHDLLSDVGSFLGLSNVSSLYRPKKSQQKVNTSTKAEIPENVKLYLSRMYYDELLQMCDVFGGYASGWVEEAEATIKQHQHQLPLRQS